MFLVTRDYSRLSATSVSTANGVCLDMNRVCDFSDDCGDGSDENTKQCGSNTRCDFESGVCDWEQDKTDNFDWSRMKGRTPSSMTGPLRDHTTGKYGRYGQESFTPYNRMCIVYCNLYCLVSGTPS